MNVEVKIPSVGESISEVTIAEWSKKDGEFVKRDDVLMVLETDKASVEVNAEAEGVLKVKVQEGETIDVGTTVGEIDTSAEAPKGAPAPQAAPAPTSGNGNGSAAGVTHSKESLQELSPAVRHIVAEHGLNPSSIPGTGKDGRLTKDDVQKFIASGGTTEIVKESPVMPVRPAGSQEQEIVPMTSIRKTIARRLVEAQHTAAILTTFNEVDLTNAMALRKKYQDDFVNKYGVKLGLMSLFTKAVIEGLKEFPAVNGQIDGTNVVYNHFYNIGIAVSTEKGLMVPVIRNADQMSLAEIELAIKAYGEKARVGRISMDDLSGGTFTVSNGGVFGSLLSTPILNPPQSGILGMHTMQDRPMAIDGEVKIRKMMYVALSYDHRMIDGREAVGFLVKVKQCVEDPQRLLIHV